MATRVRVERIEGHIVSSSPFLLTLCVLGSLQFTAILRSQVSYKDAIDQSISYGR